MTRLAALIAEHVSPGRTPVSDDFLELLEEDRAFCPGVSPPDNSCAPANKGTGKERPSRPEPNGTTDDDYRGQQTGHSVFQRAKHLIDVQKYCESLGIEVDLEYDVGPPPTMDAIEAIASGVEELDRSGIALPRRVVIDPTPGNAPAAYSPSRDEIYVSPDFSLEQLRSASAEGFVSAPAEKAMQAAMVHEMGHVEHMSALAEEYGSRAVAAERLKDWQPLPDFWGIIDDPWAPDRRESFNTERGGIPVDSSEARRIAVGVSRYAATMPVEFVAEVFSGVAFGRTYSDEVLKLYRDYGGPPLPRREQSARRSRITSTGRAFCPGASPPDNSCSPANKGSRPPKPPDPAAEYSREAAQKYTRAASAWLKQNGVAIYIFPDGSSPVNAIEAVVGGVQAMKSVGLKPPEEVVIGVPQSLSSAAEYDCQTDTILVSAYLDPERTKSAIESGWLSGKASQPLGALLVHEDTHREHFRILGSSEEAFDRLSGYHDMDRLRQEAESAGRQFRPAAGLIQEYAWSPNYRSKSKDSAPSSKEAMAIAAKVSEYAKTDPLEFVAEVRAGVAVGNKYPRDVMRLYEGYSGPPVGRGKR